MTDEKPIVLIVDDDHLFSEQKRFLFANLGYEVAVADSFMNTVLALEKYRYQLTVAIVDYHLSSYEDGRGEHVLSLIKDTVYADFVIPYLLTGHDTKGVISKFTKTGLAVTVLSKDIDDDDLVAQVLNPRILYAQYRLTHDNMSPLLNYLTFRRCIEHFLADARSVAKGEGRRRPMGTLLSLDINAFKDINDRLGHPTGDLVIEGVGRLLRDRVNFGDIVCRKSGDEYLLFLVNTRHEMAQKIADRVMKSIKSATFFGADGQQFSGVTASIGIREVDTVLLHESTCSISSLFGKMMHEADVAEGGLNEAKHIALQEGLRKLRK